MVVKEQFVEVHLAAAAAVVAATVVVSSVPAVAEIVVAMTSETV